MPALAKEIRRLSQEVSVLALNGNLGAGKTTLSQEVLLQMGIESKVSSPTFSIVNEYSTLKGSVVYHLDCYRLKSLEEALDIGIDEIIDSGSLCLIEWPEIIEELFEPPYMKILIEHVSGDQRNITLKIINK